MPSLRPSFIGNRSRVLSPRFPVDNGQNYLLTTSDPSARRYDPSDALNFVLLMNATRAALPSDKLLSIDVPARHPDMIAYNMTSIVAGLDASVDWWNLILTTTSIVETMSPHITQVGG